MDGYGTVTQLHVDIRDLRQFFDLFERSCLDHDGDD